MLKQTVIAAIAAASFATALPSAAHAGGISFGLYGHGGGIHITTGAPRHYHGGYRKVCKWKKVRVKRNHRYRWVRVKKCYRVYN